MRRRYPVILLAVLIVAIALSAALATSDAGATAAWTCGGASCHNSTAVHGVAAHAAGLANPPTSCTTVCHTDGAAAPPPPSACAGCHPTVPSEGTHASAAGVGCNAYTPCHGGASPSPSPSPTDTGTPSPSPTATDTPTPEPSATDDGSGTGGVTDDDADDVGFPATGYPPSDGGSTPWLLITGVFAAGLALLFAVWRVPAARRHD